MLSRSCNPAWYRSPQCGGLATSCSCHNLVAIAMVAFVVISAKKFFIVEVSEQIYYSVNS